MAAIINIYYDQMGHLYPDYPEKYTGEFTGQYVPLAEYQRDLANAETDRRALMQAADKIEELRQEVELAKELYASTLQVLNDTRQQRDILKKTLNDMGITHL